MTFIRALGAVVVAASLALPLVPATAAPAKPAPLTDIEDFSKNPAYAKYYGTPLSWSREDCAGSELDLATDFECDRVTVPKDWKDLSKGDLVVVISRKIGVDPAGKRYIFSNPGGPASSGNWFGSKMVPENLNIEGSHVGIGMDPRGVGGSTPIRCSKASPNTHSPGSSLTGDPRKFTAKGVKIAADDRRKLLATCLEETKDLAPYINSLQTARDFNFVRQQLGAKTADFYGISYGAWLAGFIAKMYPQSFTRVIADGNPNWFESLETTFNNFDETMQAAFDRSVLPYLAAHDDIYHLGTTVRAVNESYEKARVKALEKNTSGSTLLEFEYLVRGGLYGPTGYHNIGMMTARFLGRATTPAPVSKIAPKLAEGDDSGWDFAFDVLRCSDTPNNQDADGWFRKRAPLAKHLTLNTPSNLVPQCLGWPYKPAITKEILDRPVGNVLLVNNEADPATGYPGAAKILKQEKGDLKFVVVDDLPWHGMPSRYNDCAKKAFDDYLSSGKKPATHISCQAGPVFGEDYNAETGEVTRISNSVVYEFMNDGKGTTLPRPYTYFYRDLSQPSIDKAATDALPKPKKGRSAVEVRKLTADEVKSDQVMRDAFSKHLGAAPKG